MSEDEVRVIWSEEELDAALAALRSDVDVDPVRVASARAELVRAAGASAADADDISDAHHVPGADPITRRAPRSRSWWTASTAAALVVAVTLVAQFVLRRDSLPSADPVELLILAAARTSDEPVGPGQYRYVDEHGWQLFAVLNNGEMESAARTEHSHRTWIPWNSRDDWMRRVVDCYNPVSLPDGVPVDPVDLEVCISTPEEFVGPCGEYTQRTGWDLEQACEHVAGGWGNPNQLFIDQLPRDPDALRERILDDAAQVITHPESPERGKAPDVDPDEVVMEYASELLRTGLAPAELRAGVYRMIAKVPGIAVTDPRVELEGRGGVGFGVVVDGIRHEVVIEPSAGEFIGTRTTYLRTDQLVPAGTEFHSSVSTAVVDELGQEPR